MTCWGGEHATGFHQAAAKVVPVGMHVNLMGSGMEGKGGERGGEGRQQGRKAGSKEGGLIHFGRTIYIFIVVNVAGLGNQCKPQRLAMSPVCSLFWRFFVGIYQEKPPT